MKSLLTNFVLIAGVASLAPAGGAWAENSVPNNTVLPSASFQSPNTGPGTADTIAETAHGVTPMNDVANDTTTANLGNSAPTAPGPALSHDLSVTAMAKIHHVNQMEIEMGKLAMEKAESQEVRAFAERLMRDHQMSDRKLLAFAKDKNIPIERTQTLTAADLAKDQETSAQLHAATGSSFDRLYLQKMAEGHSATINDITAAIDELPDRSERNFLAKIRPIIGQHERLANILLSRKPS
jgi:putative membrane protein